MKTLVKVFLCLSIFRSEVALAAWTIMPVNSTYSTSAPPLTDVSYSLVNGGCTADPSVCSYSWSITNGSFVVPPGSTYTIPMVRWNNVNGNGQLSVTISSCANSCPATVTYSIPIRYLGNPGLISINGTAYSGSTTVACGTSSLALSVGAATNATAYAWERPSGWSAPANGITSSTTPNASGGGVLKVHASRADVPGVRTTTELTITRPAPGTGVSLISGTDYLCSGSTTYSLSGLTAGMTSSWVLANTSATITGPSTGSSVTATYSYPGANTVTANINDVACAAVATRTLPIQVGVFSTSQFSVTGPTQTCPSPDETEVYVTLNMLTAPPSISGYTWTVSSNWPFGYSPSGYDYRLVPPGPGFGTAWVRLSIQNGCGWSVPYQWDISESSGCSGFFSVGPNPSSDVLSLLFTETVLSKGIPETIELYSESTGMLVKSLTENEKVLKDGEKLEIDVSKLKRGTYFLHVTDSQFVGSKTKKTKVVLL